MHPDLVLLIDLQRVESAIDKARRDLSELPAREAAIDAALAAASGRRDEAKQRVADNQTARRAVEKDLAIVQSRLEKFKDQTMAVKTNKEFHALQHEIATAQDEIRKFEDRVLELMMEADELAATASTAEKGLADAQKTATAARDDLHARRQQLETEIDERQAERDGLVGKLPKAAYSLFQSVRQRGVAVSPMHEGHCGVCHVRLRPQTAQAVVRADVIQQCDSCGRILYPQQAG